MFITNVSDKVEAEYHIHSEIYCIPKKYHVDQFYN